jgi:hypothetical protein
MATAWSLYKHRFSSSGNGFAYSFDDIVKYISLFHNMMEFLFELLPDRIHIVEYEKLTEYPEQESKALIEFLDLSWEDSCLKYHEHAKVVRTSSEVWRDYEACLRDYLPELSEIEESWKKFVEKHRR